MQEVFAGFLAHTDYEIDRFLKNLDDLGVRDNTLVLYIVGDNGPSAEGSLVGSTNETTMINGFHLPSTKDAQLDELGGPNTYGHYPVGWAWAGSTPFQYFKQVASHLGAMRNPLVVSWPQRIKDKGGLRTQFHHVNDVMPTILEAAHIPVPRMVNGVPQKSLDGVSMLYSFDHPETPSTHHTQYFEIFGRRSLYHDGWWADANHGVMPWETNKFGTTNGDYKRDVWQLYNLDKDFSQATDLAAKDPQKLTEMQALFDQEAWRNNLYPLMDQDDTSINPNTKVERPSPRSGRNRFVLYPGMSRLRFEVAPNTLNRSYRIAADVELASGQTADGVLLANGGRFGGYALYVRQGKPVFAYNYFNIDRTSIESDTTLPAGKSEIRFEFAYEGGRPGSGGMGTLYINGKAVASGRIAKTIAARVSADSGDAMDIGEDTGTPVSDVYQSPFKFNAGLKDVVVELK
jgi:arylsulfatase